MAVRIEFILLAIIVGISFTSFTVKLNQKGHHAHDFTKELEFTHTTFTEVDTKKLLGSAYGTYGQRDNGILLIKNLIYHSDTIESLVAKKGIYKNNTLYLEGDVILKQKHDYTYKTQQAEYVQQTEILNITAPFIATQERNSIRGDTLTYNTRKNEVYGTMIDATIYTIEK